MELAKVKVRVRCRIRWKKIIKHVGCYVGLHHSSRLVCQPHYGRSSCCLQRKRATKTPKATFCTPAWSVAHSVELALSFCDIQHFRGRY